LKTALTMRDATPGAPLQRPGRVQFFWLVAAVVVVLVLCALSVTIGVRAVNWPDIVAALGGSTDTVGQAAVFKRIPRTLMALLAGASLGVAGAVMQGVTRNPLADPGILGVNAGAAFAVVIGIAGGVRSWMVGGVGGITFDRIGLVLPFLVLGLAMSLLSARSLNALALGDELATGLGVNVPLARGLSSLGAVMLAGAATAVCGPIGFVGLAVPHVCRLLVGVDHRWLLPFSALAGAALLVAADVLGRVVARPSELDVGVITAFVGAPIFIWIVRQRKIREL